MTRLIKAILNVSKAYEGDIKHIGFVDKEHYNVLTHSRDVGFIEIIYNVCTTNTNMINGDVVKLIGKNCVKYVCKFDEEIVLEAAHYILML